MAKNGSIHQKQSKVHFSVYVLVVSTQEGRIHSFHLISKEVLFTFPFSRIGLGFAMSADGGTIYLLIFSVQVFNSLGRKLYKFNHSYP